MNSLEPLDELVTRLLRNGSALVPAEDPLRQAQTGIGLFTDVNARLQDILGDEDFAVEVKQQEGGSLFTLKVGDEVNEPPNFSPPEPHLL